MPHLRPATGPQRVIAASNFVYTIGSGVYLTAGVLYFTEAVDLPAAQVGLGLGIAGFVCLAVGIAVGHLADTHGLGPGLAEAIDPTLLIALCITWGRPGWYVVGALFALTGLAAPFAVRRAERQRHPPQTQLDDALKAGQREQSTAV
jgi:hypothetical protein